MLKHVHTQTHTHVSPFLTYSFSLPLSRSCMLTFSLSPPSDCLMPLWYWSNVWTRSCVQQYALLQQPRVFDFGHSELLLYKNMLTAEADNNQLCWCCCSNPKHLTMSIVNYCCTRTWSCERLAWTRRPCSTLMSMTARLLTASTSAKPQVRPLPFCRLWMSNGNQCFGCCW